MVSTKSVTFFGVITAATLAGIYIVHRQQQTEREVRRWVGSWTSVGEAGCQWCAVKHTSSALNSMH